MKKHLYNTTFGKVPWFVRRFGLSELWMKPLRLTFAPLIIPRLAKKTFEFQGKTLECFYHRYNMTWAGERCVEVPIARTYLEQQTGRQVLEVGNVLSHYSTVQHEILDKFETGPGIINQDILGYRPDKTYDLILSISTFEHIGFDDESDEPSSQKTLLAVASCRKLLKPQGKLVLTLPIGYNPDLDELIRSGKLGASSQFFLRRVGPQEWKPATPEEALRCRFKSPYPYANALLIAEFDAVQTP